MIYTCTLKKPQKNKKKTPSAPTWLSQKCLCITLVELLIETDSYICWKQSVLAKMGNKVCQFEECLTADHYFVTSRQARRWTGNNTKINNETLSEKWESPNNEFY